VSRPFRRTKAHNSTQGGGAARHAKTRSKHLWTPFSKRLLGWARRNGIGVENGLGVQVEAGKQELSND
jgi:hypothetical protein